MTIQLTDQLVTSALVRQGVIPCSPIIPTVGISIDVLELYRVTHLRSPHLSVQAFVKTLCDLQTVGANMLMVEFEPDYCLYLADSIPETPLPPVLNCI
jgi:hypothetical protein